MSYGHNPEEVIKELLARKRGKFSSEFKLGLVIEGGSLRGVYSCGIADAIAEFGLNDKFDTICGNSSGALNSMYFPGSQMKFAASIYYENAVDKRCLDFRRFPNVLDVRWLVDEWILKRKRFDDSAAFEGRAEIFVPTTDTVTGEEIWFSSKKSARLDFERSLAATSMTPIVCGQSEKIGGRVLNDGLVHSAIPIRKIIEEGCTHVVVALTRPFSFQKKDSRLLTAYESWRIRKFGLKYQTAFKQRKLAYANALKLAFSGAPNVSTFVLAPQSVDDTVGNLQANADAIKRSFERARRNTIAAWMQMTNRAGSIWPS